MAENRKGKDNRFYFSRGQMVLLGGAFALTAAVIFVLGIFVGKSIEESKVTKREEPLIKVPVGPASQSSAGAAAVPSRDEITFNGSGMKGERSPASDDGKTGDPKAAEKVVRIEAKEAKSPTKIDFPTDRLVKKTEKAGRSDDTAKRVEAESATEAKDQGKVWRAQVDAFPDDRSAKQLVERLKNKGYNPYVTEVQNRGRSWYRVNIGRYGSREEADKIVEILKNKESYSKAFAASK